MSWFRLESGFRDHPKLKKLARALNISHNEAKGMVASLWCWCLDHAVDGDLSSFDAWDIADAAGWAGQPGDFMQALRDQALIDSTDHGFEVHEWMDRAGSFREALRKQKNREKKRQEGMSRDCPVTVPATVDGLSAKEDRRTGQRGQTDSITARSAKRSTPQQVSPVVFEMPTTKGSEGLTEADLAAWRRDFPGVDVMRRLREMRAWSEANPDRKKTPGGVRRFVVSWLTKEQNRGSDYRGGNGRPSKPTQVIPPQPPMYPGKDKLDG